MDCRDTPVALIVFNRPETTRRVFAAIAKARPSHLLLIADGPRPDRQGEVERCAEVKQIVSRVDWPCRVETNFATDNMGCRERVVSGLNWVFSLVEEAIILEDDCLPDQSFFPYCAELLERYRQNTEVGIIAGFNYEGSFRHADSYYFSSMVPIWGWATWARSWRQYDERMAGWPEAKRDGLLEKQFPDKKVVAYWNKMFDKMHDGTGPDTWDYQLVFTSWSRRWLNALPTTNLIQNIGFGSDATHTTGFDPIAGIRADAMHFPLHHPGTIAPWQARTMMLQKKVYIPSLLKNIQRKIS